jgi:hypothetical protein
MHSDRFEAAFEAFLEGADYERAEEGLFALVRAAFLAGWRAGRKTDKVIEFDCGRD